MKSKTLQKWLGWTMLVIFVLSIFTWYFTRATLPSEILIATAAPGGLYFKFASALKEHLEKKNGRPVRLLTTQGSVQNRELLLKGKAHLAILQAGAIPMDGLSALAPLYPDVVYVIVRRNRGIGSIRELLGKNVSLGPPGSGNRVSALTILTQYDVAPEQLKQTNRYFVELLSDDSLDAAIVTTGFQNPDLHKILKTGYFQLIPILDANALAVNHAYFSPIDIPRGLFKEGPPVPEKPVPTVATAAFLAARDDVPEVLVTDTLRALYGGQIRQTIPTTISSKDAGQWPLFSLHPASRSYYNPYQSIGVFANIVESLAGIKELLFALGAGIYLLWARWNRLKEKERESELAAFKERLDHFLSETARIEQAQVGTEDPEELGNYLDEVTQIKLKALRDFTDESLRGDSLFTIFLLQCANLTRMMEHKLSLARSRPSGTDRDDTC